MTANNAKLGSSAAEPSPLGPPQLILGESSEACDELSARICAEVEPSDFIEEMFARDFVDCEWDVLRYRRMKVALLLATAHEGLEKVLEPISFEGWLDLVADFVARKPEAVEEVNRRLAAAGLTMDAVMALTLCKHLEELRLIENWIALAEARRNSALCEIERHRAVLAHKLRQSVRQVEADHQGVEVEPAEPKRLRDQRAQDRGEPRQRPVEHGPANLAGSCSCGPERAAARGGGLRRFRLVTSGWHARRSNCWARRGARTARACPPKRRLICGAYARFASGGCPIC